MNLRDRLLSASAMVAVPVAIFTWLQIKVPEYTYPSVFIIIILLYLVIYFDYRLSEKQDIKKSKAKGR